MTIPTTDIDPNVVMFEQMTAAIDAGAAILDRFGPDEMDTLKLSQADAIALANAHFLHAIAVALGEVADRVEGVELELHNRRVRYGWPRRVWNRMLRR